MSLILYETTETEFDTNGIGILADAIDAEVYEQLNGQFELRVKYPIHGRWFRELQCDRYITAPPDPVRAPQPFRIYRISKPLAGVVTVYARHWVYRLQKVIFRRAANALTAQDALDWLQSFNCYNPHPFKFWTDKTNAGFLEGFTAARPPETVWSLLGGGEGTILDVFGGEYEFDREWVRLWNHRGEDRGVTIRYGKNLRDLQMDENIANVYTGVVPFWVGDLNGMRVTRMIPERFVSAEGNFTEQKLMLLDLSQVFEEVPTEEQLREQAYIYMLGNGIGKPEISWTVSFAHLEQTLEYRDLKHMAQVQLGDTVNVYVEKLDVDVAARVVAVTFNPLLLRYKDVTLGKVKPNVSTVIAQQSQSLQTMKAPGGQIDGARIAGTMVSRDGLSWYNATTGELSLGQASGTGTVLGLRLKGNALVGSVRTADGETELFRLQTTEAGISIDAGTLTIMGKKAVWTENGSGGYTLTGSEVE